VDAAAAVRPRGWAGEHWSEAIGAEADADVAVVARRVAARIHPPADLDDVRAEGFDAHAVLAWYLSRQDVEQK